MRTPASKNLLLFENARKVEKHMYIHKATAEKFWWITLMLTSQRVANGDSVVLCLRTVNP